MSEARAPKSEDRAARLAREKAYFDAHYESSNRVHQMKYYAALEPCRVEFMRRVREYGAGGRVLEYGCGDGEVSMHVAPVANEAVGIDISERGVQAARDRAAKHGFDNTRFEVMDAHETGFEDESFDLIAATGIIHHLDPPVAFAEIRRLLKPGGRAVFVEALGHNPAIALYRSLTASARTEDEAPLKRRDFRAAEGLFGTVDYEFHGLATLGVVPFWGTRAGRPLLGALRGIDRALFAVPGLRWNAWAVLFELRK
ncbi:MAG: class I SAM-dependent methyltransferase [Oceanicaulis sp.]